VFVPCVWIVAKVLYDSVDSIIALVNET